VTSVRVTVDTAVAEEKVRDLEWRLADLREQTARDGAHGG
jgi:hypothetical protein